jgi:aromatic ring-opening dioxygenase catalytic subunit (LigB family)
MWAAGCGESFGNRLSTFGSATPSSGLFDGRNGVVLDYELVGRTKNREVREAMSDTKKRMPTIYLPHGGGPCFFMDWTMGPPDTWDATAAWLRSIKDSLPEKPKALLVISAHWEESVPTVLTSKSPPLFFDYYGFPKHTYELTWPAPGSPELAARVGELLKSAGIESKADEKRGFDHGVFVPLKVAFPDADIPTVQLSLRAGLDPKQHIAIGRALAPLRDEGVLIIGSGMSFHNMRGFMSGGGSRANSEKFDAWLVDAVTKEDPKARDEALIAWASAPAARDVHPREEHLIPLMVAAGAGENDRGTRVFQGDVMNVLVSAVRFG